MRMTSDFIGIVYDSIHRALRTINDAEYVEMDDADDLQCLKRMAEDLHNTLENITVREGE